MSRYDVFAEEGDILYKVSQVTDREFLLIVVREETVLTKLYYCEFPTFFGMDLIDNANINVLLNEMITKVKHEQVETICH